MNTTTRYTILEERNGVYSRPKSTTHNERYMFWYYETEEEALEALAQAVDKYAPISNVVLIQKILWVYPD